MAQEERGSPIRLVLLDEQGLFRESLARLLASQNGLEVVSQCSTPAEALEVLNGSPVDLVLLDFDVGLDHANDFIRAARSHAYQGRFLIVAGTAGAESSAMALTQGASGIFLKSESSERLVQAIRLVAAGQVWIDQRVIQLLAEQCVSQAPRAADSHADKDLGDREQRVLRGILSGETNKKIATGMGLSESSVKNVIQKLFSKTGVRTRSQLVRVALEGSRGGNVFSQEPQAP